MMLYTSSSLPLILFNTFIEFLAEYVLRRNIYLMWPKWADKLHLEMAKLASFTENSECVTAFSPPLGEKENTSPSFTLKVQW